MLEYFMRGARKLCSYEKARETVKEETYFKEAFRKIRYKQNMWLAGL